MQLSTKLRSHLLPKASIVLAILILPMNVFPQTCTVSASPASVDTTFDNIFTQNGPGTGWEPSNIPGWTGADSTYSLSIKKYY